MVPRFIPPIQQVQQKLLSFLPLASGTLLRYRSRYSMNQATKEEMTEYLRRLQGVMISALEAFEETVRFERKDWTYDKGRGGGNISVLRGDVFEKAAVNWSALSGEEFPLKEATGPFFATGVSLIIHPYNPHAPTSHFNIRYIEAGDKNWFGGGYDLTPMGFPYEDDTLHFHSMAKNTLDGFDPNLYREFSERARQYFFIPHYDRERGVGGIFFDHYNTGAFETDYKMWKGVGDTFLDAVIPIYRRRVHLPFSSQDRERQLHCRAAYVEFNLLYDQGTKFGFRSGGNPEAILSSMPPLVKW